MRVLAVTALAGMLASCQSTVPDRSGSVDTHDAMVRGVNPAALAIWEVGNSAADDAGGWDEAAMDPAAWSKLQDAARALELHSRRMAEADTLYVGAHNDEIEGFASKAEIQAMIDADPDGFRELSRKMAGDARELLGAAADRDAERSAELVDGLSVHCASCHTRYWEKPPA